MKIYLDSGDLVRRTRCCSGRLSTVSERVLARAQGTYIGSSEECAG
jgi:hypothetical protein